MRATANVREANMTFGPYDAVAVIEAENFNGLGMLIASSIQPMPGVEQALTCLAVDV